MSSSECHRRAALDWRDPANYAYTQSLTRDAWAWEFLRRNPEFREAWRRIRRTRAAPSYGGDDPTALTEAARWGLLPFADPDLPASQAPVLWRSDASSFVLTMRAEPRRNSGPAGTIDLAPLKRRLAANLVVPPVQHVLFADAGRTLQLAIQGGDVFDNGHFVTDAFVAGTRLGRHMLLLRRLSDLAEHGSMSSRLYPPDPRSPRLALVLQALDGWLAGASQRVIAAAVHPLAVAGPWSRSRDRDEIRRAIARGRQLMRSGYLRFLA